MSNSRLAQMAAMLSTSPQTQALLHRKSGLQKPGVRQLSGRNQPVIQRQTEVRYQTQSVGYEDEKGSIQTEVVGKVADPASLSVTTAIGNQIKLLLQQQQTSTN